MALAGSPPCCIPAPFLPCAGTALHPEQLGCSQQPCSSAAVGAGCWHCWILPRWGREDGSRSRPWCCLPPSRSGVGSAASCSRLHCSLLEGKEAGEEAALGVVKETESEGEEGPSRGETAEQVSISPPLLLWGQGCSSAAAPALLQTRGVGMGSWWSWLCQQHPRRASSSPPLLSGAEGADGGVWGGGRTRLSIPAAL